MIRGLKSILFPCFISAATIISVLLLFAIAGTIFSKGLPALTVEFLTSGSKDFGEGGGIVYQIIGTIILMTSAGLLALPLALGTALYQTEYLRPSLQRTANILIYALNGVPTILFGLFGYLFFGIYLRMGVSWLTGSFILAIMILPTLVVSIREAIAGIPLHYREAGLALGLGHREIIRSIILPQSFFGIVTGMLLGLARAAGETAAIMFTATTFSGVRLPRSLYEPVTTLQTHILILAQEAVDPKARVNAWGAALILVLIVFLMSIASMLLRKRLKMEAGN